jgi:hypothetical protein
MRKKKKKAFSPLSSQYRGEAKMCEPQTCLFSLCSLSSLPNKKNVTNRFYFSLLSFSRSNFMRTKQRLNDPILNTYN